MGVAAEYIAFRLRADLPDPELLLDGKLQFTHDVNRMDRTMAVLSSCAALVVPAGAKDREKRADVLWGLIAQAMQTHLDVAVPAATALCRASGTLSARPSAAPALTKIRPILAAAGLGG